MGKGHFLLSHYFEQEAWIGARSQNKEEEESGPHYPKGHTPNDLKPPTRPRLLKYPLLPNSTGLAEMPLTHRLLGYI